MDHLHTILRWFVPFSLLQVLLGAQFCNCRSSPLPFYTTVFQEVLLFVPFLPHSLPIVVYPLKQATIAQDSYTIQSLSFSTFEPFTRAHISCRSQEKVYIHWKVEVES